ncbi:MAG: DUF3791 domain-containing protein [Bacteroides sp.]|nr:DUF3791 domain-containing protein [Bacteroides sp.]
MRTTLSNVGQLLATERKSKGLTQTEVGARIGVRKAMVSKIENGVVVNVDSIEKMANALGMEPVVTLQPANKPDKNLVEYVMTAIIEFARHHGLSIREASNYLNRFKGIDFLLEFYDVEHTLSFNDCVNDLTRICLNNGGGIEIFHTEAAVKLLRKR